MCSRQLLLDAEGEGGAVRGKQQPLFFPTSLLLSSPPSLFLHTHQDLFIGPHRRALNAGTRLALWREALRYSVRA